MTATAVAEWKTGVEMEALVAVSAACLALYDMAKVCLSGNWDWVDIAGRDAAPGTKVTEGYQMMKTSGDDAGAVVRVYMDGAAGEPWRQVWLEVE